MSMTSHPVNCLTNWGVWQKWLESSTFLPNRENILKLGTPWNSRLEALQRRLDAKRYFWGHPQPRRLAYWPVSALKWHSTL